VPADAVQELPGGFQARAVFTTDEAHSFVAMKSLVIEAAEWADATTINSGTLRAVSLGELQRVASLVLSLRADYQPPRSPRSGARPGRRRETWIDYELARLARRYVELCKRSPGDIYAQLAREWRTPKGEPVTETALRAAIKDARTSERGLLTKTTRGVPGGQLTPKANRILRKGKR
jgi:hypothetical protein